MNHLSTSPSTRQRDLSEQLIQLGTEAARRALTAPTKNQAERHLRIAGACIDRLEEMRQEPLLISGSMAKKQET